MAAPSGSLSRFIERGFLCSVGETLASFPVKSTSTGRFLFGRKNARLRELPLPLLGERAGVRASQPSRLICLLELARAIALRARTTPPHAPSRSSDETTASGQIFRKP